MARSVVENVHPVINQLLYEPDSTSPSSESHLSVGLPYQNTFTYFTTLTTVIIYLLVSPITQFFLFNQFNNFGTANLIWFFMTYLIGIYVIIVIVASEQMQKIFLIWSHYILGLTLVLFLLNVFVFWETIYFWVLEVEFDEHRNERANHTFDLASWEMIQTMPLAFYLGLCYLFLSDARAHYKTQDGSVNELVLSIYIALTTTTVASWNTWLQSLMV